jgi:hypothetical protein
MEKPKLDEKNLPVIYLDIDEEDMMSGLDAVSFVSNPATEMKWTMFSVATDTYNDYPQSATDNACRAIKFRDDNPKVECGTIIGWTRANQLCNKENLSLDTIGRMASFKRHQQNKDVPYDEGCGGLMWDAWGGDEGIAWALKKMEWANHNMWNNRMSKVEMSVEDDEKRIITSPVMLAETKILRHNDLFGYYYVKFSEETILKMMKKYFKDNKINRVNEEHNSKKIVDGVYMIESFIVGDRIESKLYPNITKGSWMASYFIEDKDYWEEIKDGNFTGLSLEGGFNELWDEEFINTLYSKVEEILFSELDEKTKENKIKKLFKI